MTAGRGCDFQRSFRIKLPVRAMKCDNGSARMGKHLLEKFKIAESGYDCSLF
jgi:hypothetical protein